jgi:hypothetical protein
MTLRRPRVVVPVTPSVPLMVSLPVLVINDTVVAPADSVPLNVVLPVTPRVVPTVRPAVRAVFPVTPSVPPTVSLPVTDRLPLTVVELIVDGSMLEVIAQKLGVVVDPVQFPNTRFPDWVLRVAVSVPDVVTGDPDTVNRLNGILSPTDDTVPREFV